MRAVATREDVDTKLSHALLFVYYAYVYRQRDYATWAIGMDAMQEIGKAITLNGRKHGTR